METIFEEVFNGEDTNEETFYEGSFEDLISTQTINYHNYYGVNYSITQRQKNILKNKWLKYREIYIK